VSVFGLFGKEPAADVLVVDDDHDVRTMICEVVASVGLKVVEAADGRAGYQLAKDRKPKLILLDWEMPVFTGLAALEGLKADPATKDIPVVMVTGQQTPAHVDQAIRRGAAGYIAKPVDMKRLLRKVAEFMALPNPPQGFKA
jgi:CheY-like chemotaxis protein